MLLTGRVVVIVGGAGLLGRSFAEAVVAQGGVAVIADRDAAAAARVADAVSGASPGSTDAVALEITDKTSILGAIDTVRSRYGHIDAVVNSAYPRNRNYGRKLEDVEYVDFCENLNLHLGGYFLVAQQFAVMFRNQGHGHIINIASIYGIMAPRFEIYEGTSMTMPVEYAAIKSGLIHLTAYLAKYLKGSGVRCNAISPGGILDGQANSFLERYNTHCNSKGMLERTDVQGTLIYLLSDLSKYVNGQNLIVDDGFSL